MKRKICVGSAFVVTLQWDVGLASLPSRVFNNERGSEKPGDVQAVLWCKGHDCAWSPVVASVAARCSNLEGITRCIDHDLHGAVCGAPCYDYAEGKHREVIPVDASERKILRGGYLRYLAASGDHLEVPRWFFVY